MGKIWLFILIIMMSLTACKTPPQIIEVVEEIVEVEVTEPEFQIMSIVILQADLINTKFEAVLRVNNPNEFEVELSSMKYELWGNGMFWASGNEYNIYNIPPHSFLDNKFRFSMNFIGMNRKLLDDVIAMRHVQYLFKGEAQVKAPVFNPQLFTMKYDISGYSEVKEKSDSETRTADLRRW